LSTHLDEALLSELRDVMEDDFQDLLTVFLRESAEQYRDLSRAFAGGTYDDIRALAHSLKGSCSNLGAGACAMLAGTLETVAIAQRWVEVPELLIALEQELEATHREMNGWHRGT